MGLMPEEDPKTDYIMVATGTGIAPYRGFVRRLFAEDTPAAKAYKGEAWLFLGVANSDALLYDDEWQSVLEEYADEVFQKLDSGAHIYFCGLKGMMPGIQEMLKKVCESKDLDFDTWLKGLKKNKQWHVEVY